MSETGGMDFNDQITKTFFNNVFNNEMYKIFIGFFIPAIYIVYCTIFDKMNNQFEFLGSKNGTTTVIKIIGNFTMVDSTTNDEMNWEFTVTSSFTKMVKRKKNWVFPAIIKQKKKKKGVYLCCGIVGHKVNKCIFSCTTTRRFCNRYHNDGDSIYDDDDDSQNDHRKN